MAPREPSSLMETWRHDLFSLTLFIRICEARSITGAAEQMNVATSAVSRRVALLESEAGLPLQIRKPHGVEPTTAGLLMLRYARNMMYLGRPTPRWTIIYRERVAISGSMPRVRSWWSVLPLICPNSYASTRASSSIWKSGQALTLSKPCIADKPILEWLWPAARWADCQALPMPATRSP